MNKLYPAIVAVIIIGLFVFLGLSFTGVIPSLWEILVSPISSNTPGTTDIAAALKDLSNEQLQEFMVNISQKNIDGMLKLIKRSDNLTWQGTTAYYDSKGSEMMKNSVTCYLTKDKSRAVVTNTDGKARTVIVSDKKLYINDQNSGEKYTGNIPEGYRPEQELGIPSAEDFSSVQKKDIRSVKIDRYQLSDGKEIVAIYLEFAFTDINSVEKYWLSLDYGVIVAAESRIDGVLSYSFKTSQINDNTPPDMLFQTE